MPATAYRGSRPVAYAANGRYPAARAPADPGLAERIRSYAAGLGWTVFPVGTDGAGGFGPGLGLTREQRELAADQMWDDEAVKTGVLQKCFGVMPLNLQASPEDPQSAADRDAAEFARWSLSERLEGGVPALLWSLLHCLRGHVVCEPVWRTRPDDPAKPLLEDRGRWKGKHTLCALKAKPRGSYRLEVDDFSNVLGVTASAGGFIPRTRDGAPGVVVLSYLPKYEDPHGTSDFDAAIRFWLFKLTAWRLRRLYQDRLVGPFMVGKTPGAFDKLGPGGQKAAAMSSLLAEARSCGVVVVEPGDEVAVMDLAGSSDDQFSRGIQDANSAILMNFTGAYLHTMEGKNPDARGNANVSRDVSEGHQWYLRSRVETALSQQVGPLVTARNFAGAGFPRFALEVINPAYAAAMLDVLGIVKKQGLPTSMRQWRAVSAAMPPADPEDAVPGDKAVAVPTPGGLAGQGPDGGAVVPPGPKVVPEGNDKFGGEQQGAPDWDYDAAGFDPSEPRDKDGKWTDGGGAAGEKPSAKSERAKAAHVLVGRDIQRYAEEKNEPRFAKAISGVSFPDSEPVDVVVGKGGVVAHGIELKTMVVGRDDKLTMNSYAQVRKIEWERAQKATFHTVVSDDRGVFNAKAPGVHDDSKRVYYYRRGVAGSARVSALHKVTGGEAELKRLMAMPEDKLPAAARRTDGHLRVGRWKFFQDDQGKGYANAKTGQTFRAKK